MRKKNKIGADRAPEAPVYGVPVINQKARHYYGAVDMTPDSYIAREIRKIDPRLRVVWNWNKQRWIIYETGYQTGRDHIVTRIENKDGSFRPLDQRVIKDLERMKWLSQESTRQMIRRIDEEHAAEEQAKEKRFAEEIHNIGDYYALQLMGIQQTQVPRSYQEVK